MNLTQFLRTQITWSTKTFGHGRRTEGICKHIEKELAEVRANPGDVREWIDIAILALDGAWRCVWYPATLLNRYNSTNAKDLAGYVSAALEDKSRENWFERNWPAPGSQDEAVEHVRES